MNAKLEPAALCQVRSYTDADAQSWDKYVHQSDTATFFHLSGWQHVIKKAFGHTAYYLMAETGDRTCGILPLIHVKSLLFGNALISTPFCVYGGVVASNACAANALEEAACTLAEELQVDYLELRNRMPRHPDWPTKHLYVTFRKAIARDTQAALKAIPRKQRAMIRKGIAAGLTSEIDIGVDRFYDAYSKSVQQLGTPVFSKKYFQLLKEEFEGQCEIQSILQQQRVIASVMSFYFKDEVLPYYGGGIPEARELKGNDFMYWELMHRSIHRGVNVFDYGRSKRDTGSFRFKTHWGFEPQQLYYEYYLVKANSIPDLSPKNPRYKYFIRAWRYLPISITRIIGPMLARNLG